MPLPLAAVALVLGLVVLVLAADTFVAGAERLALRRRWSPAVIGAVVVGIGTSLPELITSVLAAGRGQADLALGNAAGSNVANLLLVLGVAALVTPLRSGVDDAPRRDGIVAALASLALLAVVADRQVSVLDGLLLAALLAAAVGWQVRSATMVEAATEVPLRAPERHLAVRVVGGLVGVLIGAQLLVSAATDLAERAGVPEIVVGSVLVAVGTSLPELATAIASARRGQVQLLLGNLLGSNVFNALAVVGAAALVAAARGDGFGLDRAGFAVVVAATLVTVTAAAVLARRPVVSRAAGAVLLVVHLASVPALLAIS